MAKLYYRGMAEENGKPKLGRSARLLGVRPGIDIDVEQMPKDWLDEQGFSATHVSILPKATMLLEKYEAALESTQNDWEKV